MTDGYLLEPARVDWDSGTPVSSHYGDIYFHRGAALEEKQQVFIEPLFRMVAGMQCPQLTVAELGFGFGINCLLTAEAWEDRTPSGRLNLVSIEKHPLEAKDLTRLLGQFSLRHTSQLLEQYPPQLRGQHVIWLSSRVRLLLIFDDVEQALGNLDAQVDFWFLDGFSPARNEDMWQTRVFRQLFARSRPGAGFATYSAAGHVRRSLEASGFTTHKRTGFGHKKEMLQGQRPGDWAPTEDRQPSVTVVGAGLAGLYCAEALSRRGIRHRLVDSGSGGASNLTQLTVKPQLAIAAERRYRFSLAAFHYMQTSPGFHACGIDQSGRDNDEARRLRAISDYFPDNFAEALPDGISLHTAGWLSVDQLKASMEAGITNASVSRYEQNADGDWLTFDGATKITSSSHLVIATGASRMLLPAELQVRAIRGQAISIETSAVSRVSSRHVTLFPTVAGRSIVSGTYARENNVEIDPAETAWLVEQARQMVDFPEDSVQPWAGIRAVSRDRLPIVGTAPDWSALAETNRISLTSPGTTGLHYCTAFGSRGATLGRLCAEQVAASIAGDPAALGIKEQEMLAPARFALRDRRD